MTHVGVLVLHGMGDPEPTFADGLIRRLKARLGADAARVEFEPCYWSPILQEHQDRVWDRLRRAEDHGHDMDARWVRRWIVSALGDPAGYLSGYFKTDKPVYGAIHGKVRSDLAALEARLDTRDPGGDKPLMILAHSLGSVVASNYVWDHNNGHFALGRTPFECCQTLTSLITYGSNIPLFVPPVLPEGELVCIEFPPEALPPKYKEVAAWKNVYDPDDILGYPLSTLWDHDQGTRVEDVTMNVGNFATILASETPLAHTNYHRDRGFVKLVAGEIRKILAVP